MGAYLSQPVTDKESEDGECGRLRFGVSAMQGWRRSMEDAHLAVPALDGDESAAVFGVFDGHGGREVAHFVARHLVEELTAIGEYRHGAYEAALRRAFHRMDEMLREEAYDAELKSYKAGPRGGGGGTGGGGGGGGSGAGRTVVAGGSGEEGSGRGGGGGGGEGEEGAGVAPGNRLTAQEAVEMLQKFLVISNGGGERAQAQAQQIQVQQQAVSSSSSTAVAVVTEGEAGQVVQEQQRVSAVVAVEETTVELSLQSPLRAAGAEGEGQTSPRSPTPFAEETEGLKAQGIASPFKGGPATAVDAAVAAEGEGGGKGEQEELGQLMVLAAGEGEATTEEIVVGGAVAAGHDGGGEEEEEEEEVAETVQAFQLRGGLGGTRMVCALPDHRVQAGCTSVVALLVGNELFVANAGDSRAVLSRAGKAVALTEDHKPLQDRELTRIRRAGGFVTEQGRVNGNLNLSRSIGDLKYKGNATLPPADQMITAEPDIAHITLQPELDEFLLLACDGVWDVMTNQEAIDFIRARLPGGLAEGKPVSSVAEELLDACLAEDPRKSAGIGGDNFTCLIVQLRLNGERPLGGTSLAATGKRQSEGNMASEGSMSKAARQDDSA